MEIRGAGARQVEAPGERGRPGGILGLMPGRLTSIPSPPASRNCRHSSRKSAGGELVAVRMGQHRHAAGRADRGHGCGHSGPRAATAAGWPLPSQRLKASSTSSALALHQFASQVQARRRARHAPAPRLTISAPGKPFALSLQTHAARCARVGAGARPQVREQCGRVRIEAQADDVDLAAAPQAVSSLP